MPDEETKDAPKPSAADSGAKPIEVSDEVKARIIQLAKEKIAGEMLPALKDPRNRMRTIVAIKVLGIVEREIGKGEGPLSEEWAKLKEIVAKNPEAVQMVGHLEDVMHAYAADLNRKVQAGEVDEKPAREAALKVIRLALLKKIQIGQTSAERAGQPATEK